MKLALLQVQPAGLDFCRKAKQMGNQNQRKTEPTRAFRRAVFEYGTSQDRRSRQAVKSNSASWTYLPTAVISCLKVRDQTGLGRVFLNVFDDAFAKARCFRCRIGFNSIPKKRPAAERIAGECH